MSEYSNPELGEPSEALKQDFRDAIDGVIAAGNIDAKLALPDGRLFEVGKHDPDDPDELGEEGCFAMYTDTLTVQDSGATVRHYTLYEVNPDDTLQKDVSVEEVRPQPPMSVPAPSAQADQEAAARLMNRKALEAIGVPEEEIFRGWFNQMRAMMKPEDAPEQDYDPELAIRKALENDAAMDNYGLRTVSATELQSVIEHIHELARQPSGGDSQTS